jgi:hypothetical protein
MIQYPEDIWSQQCLVQVFGIATQRNFVTFVSFSCRRAPTSNARHRQITNVSCSFGHNTPRNRILHLFQELRNIELIHILCCRQQYIQINQRYADLSNTNMIFGFDMRVPPSISLWTKGCSIIIPIFFIAKLLCQCILWHLPTPWAFRSILLPNYKLSQFRGVHDCLYCCVVLYTI